MDTSQGKRTRTGTRNKRPTERFKSYLESNSGTNVGRRRRQQQSNNSGNAASTSTSSTTGHQIVECGTTSNATTCANTETVPEHESVDSSGNRRKKKAKKTRTYTCNHCGFNDSTCSNGQAFIKAHHSLPQNKNCYLYGLVHCPNPKCTKVCLTEKDMEMHCSMTKNSSNNPCLQAFAHLKAVEKEHMRQNSTQIDLSLSKQHMQSTTAQLSQSNGFWHLNQYLPAESKDSYNIVHHRCHQGLFNSDIHYYNILQQYDEGWVKESSTVHQNSGSDGNDQDDAGVFLFNADDIDLQSSTSTVNDGKEESTINIGIDDNGDSCVADTLNILRRKIETSSRDMCLPKEYTACFALEQILRDAGSPVYLYEKLMKWASLYKFSLPSVVSAPGRTELLNISARKVYGEAAEKMKPREIPTQLPSGRRCGITTFNLYAQIVSLLSDTNINNWNDYIFTPTKDNPFHLNIFRNWDEGCFDDIDSSIWYGRTQRHLITDANDQILIPICLFIDGTVLSLSGSLSLEPVMMCLMIHNRERRKDPRAWRPIGYLHDPASLPGKKYKKTVDKYIDYHAMLSVVLQELYDILENRDGFFWDFYNVPGASGPVRKRLVFALSFIIGDTKGHDVLCGRMGSHNLTNGLCRDCDMITAKADDPNYPCSFLKHSDLQNMSPAQLKEMSFHYIPNNAFRRITFGLSPYGINCATAIDIIHMLLLGILDYLHQTFVDHLTSEQHNTLSNTVAFMATFCSRGINDYPKVSHFRKGLGRKGIMTAKMKLSRCFLVFLALKSNFFRSHIINKKGKLPRSLRKKLRKRKGVKEDSSTGTDTIASQQSNNDDSDVAVQEEVNSTINPHKNSDSSLSDNSSDNQSNGTNTSNSLSFQEDSSCSSSRKTAASHKSSNDLESYFDSDENYDEDNDNDSYHDEECSDGTESDIEQYKPIVFSDDVYDKWAILFEVTLTFYKWLTSEQMPRSIFKHGSRSVAKYCTREYMNVYLDVARRWDGMGLKLTKFHQLGHWYFYIAMYGVPLNFDSSFCESHHNDLTKKTGRRTQKRQDKLAFQTAIRLYEKTVMNSISQHYVFDPLSDLRPETKKDIHKPRPVATLKGAQFCINLDYSVCDHELRSNAPTDVFSMFHKKATVSFKWLKRRDRKKGKFIKPILDSIGNKLSWFNNGVTDQRITKIVGFTEILMGDQQVDTGRSIIRAHPDYRSAGPWMDWIDVGWIDPEDHNRVTQLPARLIMILDFDRASYAPIPRSVLSLFPSSNISVRRVTHEARNGVYVMIHSSSGVDVMNHIHSDIAETHVMESVFQFIKVDSITGIAFVAIDPPEEQGALKLHDMNNMEFRALKVTQPSKWGPCFIDKFSDGYNPPRNHCGSDETYDEFNERHSPWHLANGTVNGTDH